MKKYILLGLALVILPLSVGAEGLTCPAGQKVESVMVGAAVPAVTHTETVIDTPAWDEIVLVSAAYDEYVNVGNWHGDYIKVGSNYVQVNHNWGNYDKVHHEAVTETIHHEAVTHEETIIDVPAVDPVYEDQCVADPSYTPPSTPAPEKKAEATPHPGGRRHCGTINTPSCEVWIANLNAQIAGKDEVKSPQGQLIDMLREVVTLLQKLQALQAGL